MADDERALRCITLLGHSNRMLRRRLTSSIGTDSSDLLSAVHEAEAIIDAKAWSAGGHPRAAAGSASGGQFVSAGSSGATAEGAKRALGGRLTDASIRAFQKAHGLQVDGTIGRQTAAALLGQAHPEQVPVGAMTDAQKTELAKISTQKLRDRIALDTKNPKDGKRPGATDKVAVWHHSRGHQSRQPSGGAAVSGT